MTAPMRFSVAGPGTPRPAAPQPKPKPSLAPLARFKKDWTSPGVYEITRAVTAGPDGEPEWLFERSKDGTWATGHFPTETVVKAGLRDLRACRAYAGSGKAAEDLGRIQAETAEREVA